MSAATQDELLIQRQYRLLEKLNESNRKYDRLIMSLASVVFETDAEGNWTFLNPAWETITGFSVAESLGKNFLYFIYPDDREKVMRESTEMRELKDDSFRSQFRYIHKTNQYIWVEVDANTLFDNLGNMAGTAGTLVNIQQQVEAMHALQEKDRHLQAAHTALETSER
ncbi:PAS domain S-box-containing protein [Mariprofundus ferrinatatus]|uniref:histidine kinase n=1 Tax=Mariprofundus ferrinatatus TaxID=1921087 RepID=A0A2K8L9Z1_9PROT|nr:PAS domain-containing protein [Mariprofundus ferrinatatus]ATX82721.1 PAS domain S-box-containing protein [Mariprofundus ferrinatatus]